MTHLFVWFLVVWGVTSILTRSRLLRPFRDRLPPSTLLGDLVRCDQCMGLWVGLSLSLGLGIGVVREGLAPSSGGGLERILLESSLDGIASSAVCAFAGATIDWLKAASLAHYGLSK